MGRLIDADALDSKLDALAKRYAEQKRFEVAKDYSFVQTVLLSAPTIDAVPVVHGRWEFYYTGTNKDMVLAECPECGAVFKLTAFDFGLCYNYCPNCGTCMDMEVIDK